MKKVFNIKRKGQSQTYELNLSYFSTDTDYKFILNLLSGGKHKHFINGIFSQSLAYDLLTLYLLFSVTLDKSSDDFIKDLYIAVVKEIGSIGYLTFIKTLNEHIESIFFIPDKPQNLNAFKI